MRSGFVSNSSSSSFIVICEGELSEGKLKKSLYSWMDEVIRVICEKGHESEERTRSDFEEEISDMAEKANVPASAIKVYVGKVSNESDDPVESDMRGLTIQNDSVFLRT